MTDRDKDIERFGVPVEEVFDSSKVLTQGPFEKIPRGRKSDPLGTESKRDQIDLNIRCYRCMNWTEGGMATDHHAGEPFTCTSCGTPLGEWRAVK